MTPAPTLSPDFMYGLGAGSIDADDVRALFGAVQRRRVRLLEVIRRQAVAAGSPVADLIQAWFRSIADGRSVAAAIDDPFVGIWAEAVLRGERSIDEEGAANRFVAPALYLDRAIDLDVSSADGALYLPRCGGFLDLAGDPAARVSVSSGRVEVESRRGTALLTPEGVTVQGAIAWHPTRQVHFEAAGLDLRFHFGSRDHAARAVGPSQPLDLDEHSLVVWTSALGRAWEHLTTHHRAAALVVGAATSVVVPQEGHDDTRHVSSSNSDGFGVIGLSFTEDLPTLAVGLVHETRHNLLSAALTAVELHDDDDTARFYAGWRDDPRPVGALLQGACAFAAVTDFWRREHEVDADARVRRRSALEVTRWWTFTRDAVDQLRASGQLTSLGSSFLDGLQDLVGAQPKVEGSVAAASSDLVSEHRTAWHAARASAESDNLAPFVGTTLADAWNQRLFAAAPTRHVDAVDLALTGDDRAAAAEVAAEALLDHPDDPAALFRFARALHRVGRFGTSASILERIQSRSVDGIVSELRRLAEQSTVGSSAVAEAIDHVLIGERPHELAMTSKGAV